MADFQSTYIPSVTTGRTWRVTFYKAPKQQAVLAASEGETQATDGASWFTFLPFSDRRHEVTLRGRATKPAVAAAFRTLVTELEANGLISPEDAAKARESEV